MQDRRKGVWAESAGALTLLLLASMVVSTVPLGLVAAQIETERQIGLALSLSEVIASDLGEDGRARAPELFAALQPTSIEVEELTLVDASGALLASTRARGVGGLDPAFRVALDQREQTVARLGPRWLPRAVEVTSPIGGGEGPTLALRVRLPVEGRLISGLSLGAALVIPTLGLLPVVFFSGWVWLRRNLVRPIQALRDGTRRIAGGQFGYQLQLEAPSELEELRDDLNALSRSLARYRRRTRRQVARLRGANAEIARAQDALVRSERLAGVGRIAAGLAHEVGNPLTAVIGFQELLAEGLEDPGLREPAVERELVERSRRELERIHRTLRQLLDYARPGTGLAEEVEIGPVLEEVVATVRGVPAARGLRLLVEAAPDLPLVRIERDKLHQVLINLLLNATDAVSGGGRAGEAGGGEVRLAARALGAEQGGGVEIRCEDSGPGFSAEALRHAFEPFFTTRPHGQGTGLGLATCQQVIEAVGGRITAENLPEGGACVRVFLPAVGAP